MGLFDRLNQVKTAITGGSSPPPNAPLYTSETIEKPSITPALFGDRAYRDEPPTIDWEDTSSSLSSPPQQSTDAIKDIAAQLSKIMGVGGDSNDTAADESEKRNTRGLFSDAYLESVAKLRLSQMKIKYNMKVSVMKMAFGKLLELVDKKEQAKEVWEVQVAIGNMDAVILEIILLDLKHQSKMGTLKPLTPDEYFAGMFTTAAEAMGGEGFKNYIDLASGGIEKAKELMKPKQTQPQLAQ